MFPMMLIKIGVSHLIRRLRNPTEKKYIYNLKQDKISADKKNKH